VAIDYEKVGRRSTEILLAKIEHPQEPFLEETIPLDLIVRKSTCIPH
jgi:DNA-binding LacI/PurR family transcriptional regulator